MAFRKEWCAGQAAHGDLFLPSTSTGIPISGYKIAFIDFSLSSRVAMFDQGQFDALLSAIRANSPFFTPATLVAAFATCIAATSLIFSYWTYQQQRLLSGQRYVAELHEIWWSREMEEDRAIVWIEFNKWKQRGPDSPAIRHYKNPDAGWGEDSKERRAHGRVLFFFADLNTFIERGMLEEDLAFRLFGDAQYSWWKNYIGAIREARKSRPNWTNARWVEETEDFERRFDVWKQKNATKATKLNEGSDL